MRGSARPTTPPPLPPAVCSGGCPGGAIGGAARACDLARIFATAIDGLRSGLRECVGPPGPHLWQWRMSGRACACARSLLRLVSFSRGCTGAWGRPGPLCGGGGCLGGPARALGVAWIFVFAIMACGLWFVTARVRGAAQASLVAVADASKGPRMVAVPPGSLLLRLVGFSWGCADALDRPGSAWFKHILLSKYYITLYIVAHKK